MKNYKKTERSFSNVETGEVFALYMDSNTHQYKLISEGSEKHAKGTEVNGFYLAAHTGATIRLNTKKEIFVNTSQFYNYEEGEQATHRKFVGYNTFTKI
jgi:hypothetical protein